MAATIREAEVVVIGAGPAGLGAAARLGELGVHDVVVLDRERTPGGLPGQCAHRGFGVMRYRFPLRGVDFAQRLAGRAQRAGAAIESDATVLGIAVAAGVRESVHGVYATSRAGVVQYQARAIVLATGCRETPRPQRDIVGSRPAGVFNTAVIQRLVHQHGLLPGGEVVIEGSEDVGLMTVRLLVRSGARVRAIVDEQPHLQGYRLNYLYSVFPFRVPVMLGYRLLAIHGHDRVNSVQLERVSDGTRHTIACDCVVLSGRFVPESTLAREASIPLDPRTGGPVVDQHFQTGMPGIYACGNVLHGAESADVALAEGERAAEAVRAFLRGDLTQDGQAPQRFIGLAPGSGVRSVVPQRLALDGSPAWLMVRSQSRLAPVRVEVMDDRTVIGTATRLWAVPHRSVKMTVRPPADTLANTFTVRLSGGMRRSTR